MSDAPDLVAADVAGDGVDLLFQQYRGKPRMEAMLRALLAPVQALEDATTAMLSVFDLSSAVGDQLDKIGGILVEPRYARGDEEYRRVLRVRVRALRSEGRIQDLEEVATLWELGAIGPDTAGTVRLVEHYPQTVVLTLVTEGAPFDPWGLARWLQRAKAASIRLVLIYMPGGEGSTFRMSGTDDPRTSAARGLGSVYADTGGVWAGALWRLAVRGSPPTFLSDPEIEVLP